MEFDLNQEPPNDSMFGLQTLLSELETAHGCIEERIRQLEAVISRSRQRQIWRQNHTATSQTDDVQIVVPIQGRISDARKVSKINNTHLVANALGRETSVKKTGDDKGGFFDCNICLDMARDPILTSCGHLFCWPCFYSCSYIGLSEMKECPVCMEKVTDKSITPIYGNGNSTNTRKSRFEESGLKVPPRPNAHRVEGQRQKLFNRETVSALNYRIPNIIAAGVERYYRSLDPDDVVPVTAERSWNSEHVRNQLTGVQQFSNALNSAMSSVNSAMDSASRLFQGLEASLRSFRASRQSSSYFDRDSYSSIAAIIQQGSQNFINAAEIDSNVAQNSDGAFMQLENQRTDAETESFITVPVSSLSTGRAELSRIPEAFNGTEVSSATPISSSSRRRRGAPVDSDVEDQSDGIRNPIRRRLM